MKVMRMWSLSHTISDCTVLTLLHNFVLLPNFIDRRFVLIAELSNLSIQSFSFLITSSTSTLSLKESLYSFSEARLNGEHHHACALSTLLSKIRVPWSQAVRYCDSQCDNQDGY